MAIVREDTAGKIRNLRITDQLRAVLLGAAEASGVDIVRVTSGGQCRRGECDRRTGSERHDGGNAADLELLVGGRALNFTSNADLPTFKAFVTAAAQAGATGLGAGVDYMGVNTIHVGFGSRAVWGAGGKAANAPDWIRRAAQSGWQGVGLEGAPMGIDELETLDSEDEEAEDDHGGISDNDPADA